MMGKTVNWISLDPTANNRLAPNQYATAPSGLLWQPASNSPAHLRHGGLGLADSRRRKAMPPKGYPGMDHYEVRTWTAWHRFVTLCMVAHAYLVVVRHAAHCEEVREWGR